MKNRKFGISQTLLLISMLLVVCAPAAAQHSDHLGGNFEGPVGGRITNIIIDRYSRRRTPRKPVVRHAGTVAATARYDDAVRFRSTGTQLKTREIANLISPGNEGVFTLLTTILQEYDKETRKIGKPNDLALALSFFLATNANIYHDAGVPPDPQVLELRDTIADTLIEANAMNSVTDRKKQEMYEALVLYTGLALATYQEGKTSNPGSLEVARKLAGQNLQAVIGISPDKISFTNQGLSIESDAVAVDDSVAAPAERPTINESSSGSAIEHYLLMRAYQDNEVAADARYTGRRVTIVGAMDFIKVENGQPFIRMSVPATSYLQMFCFFPSSQRPALATLKANQRIVVECTSRGLVGGMGGGRLTLDNCLLK